MSDHYKHWCLPKTDLSRSFVSNISFTFVSWSQGLVDLHSPPHISVAHKKTREKLPFDCIFSDILRKWYEKLVASNLFLVPPTFH